MTTRNARAIILDGPTDASPPAPEGPAPARIRVGPEGCEEVFTFKDLLRNFEHCDYNELREHMQQHRGDGPAGDLVAIANSLVGTHGGVGSVAEVWHAVVQVWRNNDDYTTPVYRRNTAEHYLLQTFYSIDSLCYYTGDWSPRQLSRLYRLGNIVVDWFCTSVLPRLVTGLEVNVFRWHRVLLGEPGDALDLAAMPISWDQRQDEYTRCSAIRAAMLSRGYNDNGVTLCLMGDGVRHGIPRVISNLHEVAAQSPMPDRLADVIRDLRLLPGTVPARLFARTYAPTAAGATAGGPWPWSPPEEENPTGSVGDPRFDTETVSAPAPRQRPTAIRADAGIRLLQPGALPSVSVSQTNGDAYTILHFEFGVPAPAPPGVGPFELLYALARGAPSRAEAQELLNRAIDMVVSSYCAANHGDFTIVSGAIAHLRNYLGGDSVARQPQTGAVPGPPSVTRSEYERYLQQLDVNAGARRAISNNPARAWGPARSIAERMQDDLQPGDLFHENPRASRPDRHDSGQAHSSRPGESNSGAEAPVYGADPDDPGTRDSGPDI